MHQQQGAVSNAAGPEPQNANLEGSMPQAILGTGKHVNLTGVSPITVGKTLVVATY